MAIGTEIANAVLDAGILVFGTKIYGGAYEPPQPPHPHQVETIIGGGGTTTTGGTITGAVYL